MTQLSTDGDGNIAYHEFTTIADWLEASYEQGGLTTGQNFERLIRLLETIEDNRIMEAIRAKDRATAKKIVKAMEKRAKARPVDNMKARTPQARTLPAHGEIGNGRSRVDKTENVNSTHKGGTSSAYRLGKIKRDHPELAERIMAGEFKSVSEAERAAGLRKPLLTDYEKAQPVIQDDAEALALFREAMVEVHGGDRKSANIKTDIVSLDTVEHGNSKSYTVSRLKRDRPEHGFNRHNLDVTKVTSTTPSQTTYASEMGVSRKTVNDWESDAKILD